MRNIFSTQPPTSHRGFTLVEIAIVLGVISVILGLIWETAATVTNANRVKTGSEEFTYIIQNVKKIYGFSPPGMTGFTDVTMTMCSDQVFPAYAVVDPTCSSDSAVLNPWGGIILIEALGPGIFLPGTRNSILTLWTNVTTSGCINMMSQLINRSDTSQIGAYINGVPIDFRIGSAGLPAVWPSLATITADCNTPSGKVIIGFFYQL